MPLVELSWTAVVTDKYRAVVPLAVFLDLCRDEHDGSIDTARLTATLADLEGETTATGYGNTVRENYRWHPAEASAQPVPVNASRITDLRLTRSLAAVLESMRLLQSDDPVKAELEVTCERCDSPLCDAEHPDSLATLARMALDHIATCPRGEQTFLSI